MKKAAASHQTSQQSDKKKRLWTVLRIAAAPLLLFIIMLRVDLRETAGAFARIKPLPFIMAAALVPLNFAVQIVKWRFLLSESSDVTTGDLIRSIFGGYAFMLAIPGRVGEFSRALFIHGESKLKIMGLVLLDKLTAFSIVVLLSGFSLALWQGGLFPLIPLVLAGLYALVTWRPELLHAAAKKLFDRLHLKDHMAPFLHGIQTLSSRRVVVLLLISLFYFLIYSTQFFLLLHAWERVALRTMAICFPLVMLANSLPITIGGLGLREGAAVLLFSRYEVQEPSALGAALLLFAINILIPGLCGLVFIHRIGTRQTPIEERNL